MYNEDLKKIFPDWDSIPEGEWSKHNKIIKTTGYDVVEIGLYREPDGSEYGKTLTLQIFINDNVVVCKEVPV